MNDHWQPPQETGSQPDERSRLLVFWETLSHLGVAEAVLRLGTHVVLVALILFVAWLMREFYGRAQVMNIPNSAARAAPLNSALIQPEIQVTPTEATLGLPATLTLPDYQVKNSPVSGLTRQAGLHTEAPSHSRLEVTEYVVQTGDTLFAIAEKFGLKPETILWANQLILGDNPHQIRAGQKLNILPVDGAYHRWSAGEGLNGVAKFFGVKPDDIVAWSGNYLDAATIGDFAHPNIAAGTWLVIPGGHREFVNWSMPPGGITRENPSAGRILGPGACSSEIKGVVGAGIFIWPANQHTLSGLDYLPSANHPGIDIAGRLADPVMAVDSGVVVYAGWNDWGYGNVVVLNHGNGWQTLYAHLSTIFVSCGQGIYQSAVIGQIGSTGNSTGAHLHFEMMYNGVKVNPHDYLP